MSNSIWIHNYTLFDKTFGNKLNNERFDLLKRKGFNEIFINNTDGFATEIVKIAKKFGFRTHQWILDPLKRTKEIEQPIKQRDGFILDIEPFFIPKDLNIIKYINYWKETKEEEVFLVLPSPDYIFTYKLKGYVDWLKRLKETNQLDYFDRIYVMEYTSYPFTFIKPIWLINKEIKYLSNLVGKEVIPIFSIYDWNEWFAKKVINIQIKKYMKLKELYPNHSVFAWSIPFEKYLR